MKMEKKEAHTVIGNARIIHDALIECYFSLDSQVHLFQQKIGIPVKCSVSISMYMIRTQAVEDGATRPVYYESRVVHLKLDQNTLALIDSTYDILEQQSDNATIEKVKNARAIRN